jgi:hypothetical protein
MGSPLHRELNGCRAVPVGWRDSFHARPHCRLQPECRTWIHRLFTCDVCDANLVGHLGPQRARGSWTIPMPDKANRGRQGDRGPTGIAGTSLNVLGRTPGVSLFVNSTPAFSKTRYTLCRVCVSEVGTPSASSMRLIVVLETPGVFARSRTDQRRYPRAIRICAPVIIADLHGVFCATAGAI